MAVLHSQDALGQSGGGIAQELAKAAGLNVVAVETFSPQDTNMTPQLLRIREKAPDAIIVWSANPGPTIVVKNALEMGLKTPIFLSHAQSSTAFITQGGAAAEGVYIAAIPIVAPEAIPDSDPRKPIVVQFAKQYKEKYGQPADQGSGHGLDAVLILDAAAKLVKGPLTRESLRDALEAVKMCGSNGCRQMRPDDHRGLAKGRHCRVAGQERRVRDRQVVANIIPTCIVRRSRTEFSEFPSYSAPRIAGECLRLMV